MGRNAKQPRKKMRFTLRAMFVLTTLVAVATFVYQQQSRMRQAVQQIQAVYGKVEYHPEMLPGLERRTDNWFASVKAVRLWGGNIDDETLKLLREFNRLEILHLRSSNVTHEGLRGLGSNSKLEELSLEDCQGIRGSAFDELNKFKNLKRLNIKHTSIEGNELRRLAELVSLEEVTFTGNHGDAMNAEDVDAIAKVPKVSATYHQRLSGLDDDSLLRFLSIDISQTQAITIAKSRLTKKSLSSLGKFKLTNLYLRDCSLAGEDLASLNWKDVKIEIEDCGLVLSGLTSFVGQHAQAMYLYGSDDSKIQLTFDQDDVAYGVNLIGHDKSELSVPALTPLRSLKFVAASQDLVSALFPWLIAAQPTIHLKVGCEGELQPIWDAVAQTPSLIGLHVDTNYRDSVLGEVRFSSQHCLKHLTVSVQPFHTDQSFFDEVAKLVKLEQLDLYGCKDLGAELATLGGMPKLRQVNVIPLHADRFRALSADAVAAFDSIGFELTRDRWTWEKRIDSGADSD